MSGMSYDVRVWSVRTYNRASGQTFGVRWAVAGEASHRTFRSRALATSFHAELITATRQGLAFEIASGLPPHMKPREDGPTWYKHACAFVDGIWKRLAPGSRQAIADCLTTITMALLNDSTSRPTDRELRAALYGWAFNAAARKAGPPPENLARVVTWVEGNSLPLAALDEARTMRGVLDAISVTMKGRPAAATTIARRRAVLHNALRFGVELLHFPANPLTKVRWTAPKVAESVDRRSVVNHDQLKNLLSAVATQGRMGRHLVGFFACMYYAAMRPAEVIALQRTDLVLPEKNDSEPDDVSAWGELRLSRSDPTTALIWTNNGKREPRELKHRSTRDVRIVPCVPPLSRILSAHIEEFGVGTNGRLFSASRGGPVPEVTYGEIWRKARRMALSPAEVDSPLAARPYDLRHAAVSTWLNAGVDATQVAEWAGHSVNVLLKVYAKCIVGRDEIARRRVAEILDEEPPTGFDPG